MCQVKNTCILLYYAFIALLTVLHMLSYLLLQISNEPGNQYNVSLINALVLFVGTQAIAYIHSKGSTPSASTIAYTAHMDIFQHLLVDLDTEGKCKSYDHIVLC